MARVIQGQFRAASGRTYQLISYTPNCHEESIAAEGAEFVPEVFYVDINNVARSFALFFPDGGGQPLPGKNLIFVAKKEFEYVELLSAEGEDILAYSALSGGGVENQRSAGEDAALGVLGSTYQRPDPCDEFAEIEGLPEVIVGSEVQTLYSVLHCISGSKKDDRSMIVPRTEGLQNFESVEAWKHYVEKYAPKV